MYTKRVERSNQKAGLLIHPAGLTCREPKTSSPQAKQREPHDIKEKTPSPDSMREQVPEEEGRLGLDEIVEWIDLFSSLDASSRVWQAEISSHTS